MINIFIQETTTYSNLSALKEILRDRNWELKDVSILYNPARGLPNPSHTDKWPFKANFNINGKEVSIRIFTLTVGYDGTGPHDLASILDFLGVNYTDEEIYTKSQMDYDGYIRLHYLK